MPIGAGGLAAIESATNIGQGIMDQIFAKRNVRLQSTANKKLAAYTNQMNVENWKRENEYNTPAAQMARYKEAGLNPNLIYGQGTPGNAGSIPNYSQPTTDVTLPLPKPIEQMGQTIGNYQDIQLKKANIDNVRTQTTNAVTNNARDLLMLEYEKNFGATKRMWENANLQQSFNLGKQKELLGGQELEQQIMKTGQTRLLMPYQNVALQAEYAVKSRAMEKYNLDLALLNQQREVNRARIDLMEQETELKKAGLPNAMWDTALKSQEWLQNKELFPTTLSTKEAERRWLPWKNVFTVAGTAVGAGVGAGVAVSKMKKGQGDFTTVPGGYKYYR